MPVQARHGGHRDRRPGRNGPARGGLDPAGRRHGEHPVRGQRDHQRERLEARVAWTVPLTISTTRTEGAYATTPVIVNGVVYVQDLES